MNIDIEYTEFERLVIKKTMPEYLGFSDINSFVFKMIDDLSTDFMWQKDMLKMLYTESQSLSHGNGYMLISNDGTFMDSNAACKAIDVLLWSILKEYKDSVFKLTNKKLQYDINKLFDEYSKIHFEKIIAEEREELRKKVDAIKQEKKVKEEHRKIIIYLILFACFIFTIVTGIINTLPKRSNMGKKE